MAFANLIEVLEQYADPETAHAENAERDFEQVSQTALPSHLAAGLTGAFESDQTPPFPQMIATLFENSDAQQRAGILNDLLRSVRGETSSGLVEPLLGRRPQITAEQTEQVPLEKVQRLAEAAEKNDASIIDKASNFYAQYPGLIKALGARSLAIVMSHMAHKS
ncbi:MAG: hypothetical protein JOZ62_23005 [Acidobacteriaceae bacterium]|nr:hypothetical protein [Acidobacteriaceae bacterium]